MAAFDISGFSPRMKFVIVTGLTLVPLAAILMLVLISVYFPVFGTMREVVHKAVDHMMPVSRLQIALQRAAMPPNDFLIHGDIAEREKFAALAADVDRAFAQVMTMYADQPADMVRVEELWREWGAARMAGEDLLAARIDVARNENSEAMQRFDARIDHTTRLLDAFNTAVQAEIIENFAQSRHLERWGLYLTGGAFFLALVLGLGGSVLLSRERKILEESAMHDPLTGVYNRLGFETMLKEVTRATLSLRRPRFAVILFDGDDFKKINDTHGHPVGDEVLRTLAATTHSHLRDTDFFARLGGDEFVIILADVTDDQVMMLSERLRETIARTPMAVVGGKPLHLTVTMGVAVFPTDADSEETLLAVADSGLYEAKRLGRNRVCRGPAAFLN